jgi:hypothetical protein
MRRWLHGCERPSHCVVSKLEQLPAGQKDGGLEQVRIANYNWIVAQGDERTGFDTKFKPFLVPSAVKLLLPSPKMTTLFFFPVLEKHGECIA